MQIKIVRSTNVKTTVILDLDKSWDKLQQYIVNDEDLDSFLGLSKQDFLAAIENGSDLSILFDRLVNFGLARIEPDEFGDEYYEGYAEK
jgi:hypothetical protein